VSFKDEEVNKMLIAEGSLDYYGHKILMKEVVDEDKVEVKHEKKEDIEGDKKENREDAKDETKNEDIEKAKKKIHTSRFRAYCDQELSSDLDKLVIKLMSHIIRFQDKDFAKDPILTKERKRYVVGLRDTFKALKVKKVSCVLMAPDLDRKSREGGLDKTVDNIKDACKEQNVPVVYTLSRYKLGRACVRRAQASSLAILNEGFHGCDENYKMMIDMCTQLKQSYAARLNIEFQQLQSRKPDIPGKDECVLKPQSNISSNDKKKTKKRKCQRSRKRKSRKSA